MNRIAILAAALAIASLACSLAQRSPGAGLAETPGAGSSPDALAAEFAALPAGSASAGQQVFSNAGCSACHALQAGGGGIAPSLAGIGTTAETRRPDYSAELYVYESIVDPRAFTVPGFIPGIMPEDFRRNLSEQELADVIAFLTSQ